MCAQVEGVVHAVAEATTAQPSGGATGSTKVRGINGAAPRWNQPSALVASGRGPHWPLKVGVCLRPLLQGFAGPVRAGVVGWDGEDGP
jgi:hypothetical protein